MTHDPEDDQVEPENLEADAPVVEDHSDDAPSEIDKLRAQMVASSDEETPADDAEPDDDPLDDYHEEEESEPQEEETDEPEDSVDDTADEQIEIEDEPAEEQDEDDLEGKYKDLTGAVPDEEWKSLPQKTRDRIKAYRDITRQTKRRVVELEQRIPEADYGKSIIDFADQHQISDQSLGNGLEIIARLDKGGDSAVETLKLLAQHYGVDLGQQAQQPPEMPEWLQKQIDEGETTEDAAQRVLKHISVQEPAPRAPAPQQPQVDGREVINERAIAHKARLGDTVWSKIEKDVVHEVLKHKGKGIPESAWGALFDQAVETVVERRRKRPTPQGKRSAPVGAQPPAKSKPRKPDDPIEALRQQMVRSD